MSNEVSQSEILNKYNVKSVHERSTGWRINMVLTDKETNGQHHASLYWDEDTGYKFEIHNPASEKLVNLMSRPEFEYSLDCIFHPENNLDIEADNGN